jgi:hypothetical protein
MGTRPIFAGARIGFGPLASHISPYRVEEFFMTTLIAGRRGALQMLGRGLATSAVALVADRPATVQAAITAPLTVPGANALTELGERLAKAPRRRSFKTVPMILTEPDQWDHEALTEVLNYRPATKQAWDMTEIDGPWLDLMRNALNAQIWSFKHPDFLAVAECHGTANLALYDDAIWEKYQISKLAGDKFKTNTLLQPLKPASADPHNYEDPLGAYSSAETSIPALMRRGVVFMSCHNAIWEQAALLLKNGVNPDKLSHDALAAELTNHLIPGVVLTPGASGTLPELQQAGFHYIAG